MKNRALAAFVLAISLCFCAFSFAQTEEESAKELQQLKADFQEEISYPPYSDYVFPERYWDSDSGRKIIAMGKRALPFIMEEIKNGETMFTVAASRITGIKMSGPTADDLSQQWLDWWQENRDNPEWKAFDGLASPRDNNSGY